jgi:hypothetical protein
MKQTILAACLAVPCLSARFHSPIEMTLSPDFTSDLTLNTEQHLEKVLFTTDNQLSFFIMQDCHKCKVRKGYTPNGCSTCKVLDTKAKAYGFQGKAYSALLYKDSLCLELDECYQGVEFLVANFEKEFEYGGAINILEDSKESIIKQIFHKVNLP